jgi:sarcosine oxidase delta subunit
MTPSIVEAIAIGLSIALCAASFVMARHSRAYRIQAEAAADRAEAAAEASRALRMVQDLEDTRRSYLAAGDPTGRPTHPDGTPYRYSEITAEGWEHCDGCRQWGQWTIENPHDCPNTAITGIATSQAAEPGASTL